MSIVLHKFAIHLKLKLVLGLATFIEQGGEQLVRMKSSMLMSLLAVPFIELIKRFLEKSYGLIVGDEIFVIIWAWTIIIDVLLGMLKHWKLKDFDFTELFIGFVIKMIVSALGMMTFNLMCSIPGIAKMELVASGLRLAGQVACFIYVGGSAFKSCYVISDKRFPPEGFMKRMKNFNQSFNVSDITEGKKETPPIETTTQN